MDIFDANHTWLDQPGRLIAAIPALLGFVPEQSLVLVTVSRGELSCAMRADLSDDALGAALHMADVAATSPTEYAVMVIVDDAGAACRMCTDDFVVLADEIADALDDHGIVLWAAFVVDRVAAGGHWNCIDGCGNSGTVDDPSSSPVAAAAVLRGRRLCARRDELVDIVSVTDPARSAVLAGLIASTAHAGGDRPNEAAREDVHHAIEVASDLAAGRAVADDAIARVAASLTDPRVRDTLYAWCVGPTAAWAEALWATLTRLLPEPWRAEALVLLAFSAYVRGDGTLAGISLDAALHCHPGHRMAVMLDQALRSGMRPEQIRELARTGHRMAKRIGVDLPPESTSQRPAC